MEYFKSIQTIKEFVLKLLKKQNKYKSYKKFAHFWDLYRQFPFQQSKDLPYL